MPKDPGKNPSKILGNVKEEMKMSIGRFTIDGNGTVHVKNESAYWIPEMTVMEVFHGTTYIVNGSYEGTESIYRNLERIMERKATGASNESEESDETDEETEG